MPELPAPDDGKILQKLRRRYSTHLLLLAFVGIAAGVALGYTGNATGLSCSCRVSGPF